MFKVGDIVIGKPNAPYAWTGPGTKNEIIETEVENKMLKEHGYIFVRCLNNRLSYLVDPQYFSLPNTNEMAAMLLNKEE